MKKFQSFVKTHKKKLIILTVVLVILIVFLVSIYQIFKYLTPDQKQSVYGDRCEPTKDLPITSERKKQVKEIVESYENMTLSTVDVKCNLIDIIVKVEDEVPVDTSKEMANKLLTVFSEEELKNYEFEVWIDSKKKESENYPIIGKRHKVINGEANDYFVW